MFMYFRRALRRAFRFSRSRLLNGVSVFFTNSVPGLSVSAIRHIEKIVAEAEGEKVGCLRYSSLQGLSSYDVNRRFGVAECLVGCEKKISLFVKVGGMGRRKYRLTKALSELCLPVPRFYGAFHDGGRTVALWRYSEGRCLPAFQFFTDENFAAAAKSVATYNVVGLQCDRSLIAGKEPRWASPVAHQLRRIINSHEELLARRDVIERFAFFESELLTVLNGGGVVCLNHNDFKASNMIFLEDGSCQLVDLDSTALGQVGASLRCFSYLPFQKRDLIVKAYVDQLREFGVICLPDFIHQVMCAQQLMWAFHTGLHLNCIKRMISWLDHFEKLYIVEDGALFLRSVGFVSDVS